MKWTPLNKNIFSLFFIEHSLLMLSFPSLHECCCFSLSKVLHSCVLGLNFPWWPCHFNIAFLVCFQNNLCFTLNLHVYFSNLMRFNKNIASWSYMTSQQENVLYLLEVGKQWFKKIYFLVFLCNSQYPKNLTFFETYILVNWHKPGGYSIWVYRK